MMTLTLSSDSSVSQEPSSLTGRWMLCRSQGCLHPSLVWPGLPHGTAAVEVTLVLFSSLGRAPIHSVGLYWELTMAKASVRAVGRHQEEQAGWGVWRASLSEPDR